jgi:uncharacterized peroxidase-related enzyme
VTADSTEPERVAASPDAWIATVPWSEATGVLREAYDWQAAKLGEPTEFTQLGSLAPELVMLRLDLYRTVEAVDSNLTVEEKRLAAYVTSIVNSTPHCSSGLELQLHRLGIDPEVIARTAQTPEALASGNDRWDEIVAHASVLARHPSEIGPEHIQRLRAVGLEDLDVLDLNNIVAYYAYINRVATGLGLVSTIPAEHAFGAAPE